MQKITAVQVIQAVPVRIQEATPSLRPDSFDAIHWGKTLLAQLGVDAKTARKAA